MIDFTQSPLSAFAIRIIGVLLEKQTLTPDVYPLSINAIVNGANQLSNREPVMQIGEATVEAVLKELQEQTLVRTYYPMGSRVPKYEQVVRDVFSLDDAHAALITVLLLRGAQTPGELRQRTARMYPFASTESVERALTELAGAAPPLCSRLPRAPGEKEARWMHLFAGTLSLEREAVASGFGASDGSHSGSMVETPTDTRIAALQAQCDDLRREIEALRSEFANFKKQFD
jgi:uncharacterized protein